VLDSLATWQIGPLLLTSILLLPLFWSIEKRAADPIIRPAVFDSRQIRLTCSIAFGVGAIQAGQVFYPALAVAALDVTKSDAAWLMLPGVLAAMIGSPLAGKLVNSVGTRRIIIVSLLLVVVSIGIFALTELSVVTFLIAGAIGGAGMSGLLGAPLRMILLNESRSRERGAVQGLLTVFMSTGRLAGAAVVGGVAASQGGGAAGYQSAFVVMAVVGSALLMFAAALDRRGTEAGALPDVGVATA